MPSLGGDAVGGASPAGFGVVGERGGRKAS